MAGRSDDTTGGVAGYVSVGLGNPPAGGGLDAASWTWILFVLALLFVFVIHFRIGFSASH